MVKMYADDIVWYLPPSLGAIAGPHQGRDAVEAFNKTIWGTIYAPDGVEVDVLEEIREGERSAARFIYNATLSVMRQAEAAGELRSREVP